MSRSGNHAVINWILAQATGRVCFLNCAEPKTNPFETARPLDCGTSVVATDPDFDLEAERAGRLSRKDLLVFSHEDTFLGYAFGGAGRNAFEAAHDRWVGLSRRRHDVLLLRDPFNLFASRRRWQYCAIPDHTAVRMWKQHARAFLAPQRHGLRHATVTISYNLWVADAAYRRAVADALGLVFTDAGLDQTARCGGGSSFDGMAYDGRARDMKVFDRWRARLDDRHWRALFTPDVLDLSEAIFGELPPAVLLRQPRQPAHLPEP